MRHASCTEGPQPGNELGFGRGPLFERLPWHPRGIFVPAFDERLLRMLSDYIHAGFPDAVVRYTKHEAPKLSKNLDCPESHAVAGGLAFGFALLGIFDALDAQLAPILARRPSATWPRWSPWARHPDSSDVTA